MSPDTVREHLAGVLQAEGVAFDDGALQLLSRAARGSMRDALSLTDQAIAYGGGRFDEAVVSTMLGVVDGGVAAEMVRALARRDGPAALACVDRLRAEGLSPASTLEQMAGVLQQMAVEQAVPGALPGDDPDARAARDLSALLPADETQLMYSIVLHGRSELGLMSDDYAAMTMVLLRFLAFPPSLSPSATPSAGSGAKSISLRAPPPPALAVPTRPQPSIATQERPAPSVEVQPLPPRVSVQEATPTDRALGERWNTLVRHLIDSTAVSGLVRELAWQSALVAVGTGSPPTWQLRAEHESLRGTGLREQLAAALSAMLGEAVLLDVDIGPAEDTPARREAVERARRQRAAEETIRGDPVVKDLMSQFKSARIVPGSIKPL
jgi:DNA polymerase-3 subunit gamma/tau